MEIPAWKKPLGLLARMHGTRLLLWASRGIVGLGLSDTNGRFQRMTQIGKTVGHVLDILCDEMHDNAFTLQIPCHAQQPPPHDNTTKPLIDLWPDDNIGRAAFVLQSQEDHTRGGAGALAGNNKPAHTRASKRHGSQLVMRC